ncbi:hypothetical protein FD724_06940 [Nostoc sp. C057]|uniref:hypothetical protein n=1 Tax=Nostoc sp. C057 TaxID=2576903 RepID=UPI0015C2DFC9|nr:hypothetical protein [Nostoc sp. C057]QLE47873.1 hypothetical protein FD724_06940 [Nostoc sp. C057]
MTNLASGVIASTTTADISTIKIRKNFGKPGVIATITTASVGALGKNVLLSPTQLPLPLVYPAHSNGSYIFPQGRSHPSPNLKSNFSSMSLL